MKQYDYIIFDIDDTLLDYQNAEAHVMKKIFEVECRTLEKEDYDKLWELSWLYWDKYRLSESTETYVQEHYHALFYEYLKDFMADIKNRYELGSTVEALTEAFVNNLANEAEAYVDTEWVLRRLAEITNLAIASNGLGKVQRNRMKKFAGYFSDMFISEELGIIKPSCIFWDKVFEKLIAEPEKCLMVGDSLNNDIVSAACYGLDTCWINRKSRENTTGIVPTYEVRELAELIVLLESNA